MRKTTKMVYMFPTENICRIYDFIKKKNISLPAIGFYFYLISGNFDLSDEEHQKNLYLSKEKLRKLKKELIDRQLMIRQLQRDEKSQFKSVIYFLVTPFN